jgi:hypothetical protein
MCPLWRSPSAIVAWTLLYSPISSIFIACKDNKKVENIIFFGEKTCFSVWKVVFL